MNRILKVIILVVIFTSTINVSAKESLKTNTKSKDISIIQSNNIYEDILDERTKSTSLPTSGLNLGLQSYKATIVRASRSWVYTNCYFIVGDNRTINIYYELESISGKDARIGLYDMTSGKWIQEKRGLVGTMSVTNLDKTHKYAVGFTAYQDGLGTNVISGTAIITN